MNIVSGGLSKRKTAASFIIVFFIYCSENAKKEALPTKKKERLVYKGKVLLITETNYPELQGKSRTERRIARYFEKCAEAFGKASKTGLFRSCAALRDGGERKYAKAPFLAVFTGRTVPYERSTATETEIVLFSGKDELKHRKITRKWDSKKGIMT